MKEQIYDFLIECPNCCYQFNLYSVLSDKIKEQIDEHFRNELNKQKESEIQTIRKSLSLEYEQKLESFKREQVENETKFKKVELELRSQLEKQKNEYQLELKRTQEEFKNTLELIRKQNQDIQNQKDELLKVIDRQQKELEQAREFEMQLRRKEQEVFEKEKNLELEVQRKLSLEREKVEDLLRKKFFEESQMILEQKDKTISDMQKKIEELNFKLQQGSQQLQGEIQEIVVEEILRDQFPLDNILAVPKGIRGADLIQEVYDRYGNLCGKIVWESKRTTNWSSDWISKLKEDRDEINAEVAVIITRAMPKEIKSIGLIDGIWVSDFSSFVGLAMALRENLLQIHSLKSSLAGKDTKMEQIYNYICSEQFANKIIAIVEAFRNMKNDLDKERIAMEKHWRKREEELNKVIKNTVRIYGELEALAGNQLPTVPILELPGSVYEKI